jgi:hypothetical protein
VRYLTVLLSLLFLLGCGDSSGSLGGGDDDDGTDDDDDGTDDDDDGTDDDDGADDDDIQPGDDDDATPPKTLLLGFLMYDSESEGGPTGAGYGLLPMGSIDSCGDFFESDYDDKLDDFIGLYFISGRTAGWEGEYVEFYGDCGWEEPDAQCFTAWGKSPGNDFWEAGPNDSLLITSWGDVIYGVLSVRGQDLGFAMTNCGEVDFDENYDGEHGSEGSRGEPPRTSEDGSNSWKLRFR